jgi:hypothetical protein
MFWLMLVAFGAMTAVHERLTCAWLRAFQDRHVWRAVGIGMLLEAGTWAPILGAQSSDWVAVACVLGAGLGIYLGIRRSSTESSTSPETACNGRDRLGGSIERKLLSTSLECAP